MRLENRIAAGLLNAQTLQRLEALSTPLAHKCSICSAATRRLIDTRIERCRCLAGHTSWIDVFETMDKTAFDDAMHLDAP